MAESLSSTAVSLLAQTSFKSLFFHFLKDLYFWACNCFASSLNVGFFIFICTFK